VRRGIDTDINKVGMCSRLLSATGEPIPKTEPRRLSTVVCMSTWNTLKRAAHYVGVERIRQWKFMHTSKTSACGHERKGVNYERDKAVAGRIRRHE
jgi:hypothetical protein